ncbi:MAG: BON domain-containing protein [Chitinispirillaceae bacterium]
MAVHNERLKKSVEDQLSWDNRIRSSKIEISVTDHTVVLSGTVPSYWEKVAAEADVWTVPGIASVTNNLLVSDLPRYSDEQIRENAATVLRLNEATGNENIEVDVSGGKVELRGSVNDFWRRARAVDLVSHVKGVIGVVDEISVVSADQPGDELVASDIIEAIKRRENIDMNHIHVEVDTGKVILRGRVPDWQSYTDVYTIVKRTRGVAALRNELVITPEM